MTSGLPRDLDEEVARTCPDLFQAISQSVTLGPRGTHVYSNLSYAVAGYVLTMMAGSTKEYDFAALPQAFGRLLQEKVLEPLGLSETKVLNPKIPPLSPVEAETMLNALMYPAGPTVCSITDLTALVRAEMDMCGPLQLSPRVVSERFDRSHSAGAPWLMGWALDDPKNIMYMGGKLVIICINTYRLPFRILMNS